MNRVSKRVMKIQLDSAKTDEERNLELAEAEYKKGDKFMDLAIKAEQDVRKLEAQLK